MAQFCMLSNNFVHENCIIFELKFIVMKLRCWIRYTFLDNFIADVVLFSENPNEKYRLFWSTFENKIEFLICLDVNPSEKDRDLIELKMEMATEMICGVYGMHQCIDSFDYQNGNIFSFSVFIVCKITSG